MQRRLPGLLVAAALVALVGCDRAEAPGELVGIYRVIDPRSGDAPGEVRLYRTSDGEGWVEECAADLGDGDRRLGVRKTASLRWDGNGAPRYRGRHLVARRFERLELSGAPEDALRWKRTQGIAVERRLLVPRGGRSVPIVEAPMSLAGLDARCGLLSAVSAVRAWRAAGSPPHLTPAAVHLPRGRLTELRIEARERREVLVEGAPTAAVRLFVHTPFAGGTVWVEEAGGRILSLTGAVSFAEIRLRGFDPPAPPARSLPRGLVEEDRRLDAEPDPPVTDSPVDTSVPRGRRVAPIEPLSAPLAGTLAVPDRPPPAGGRPVALLLHGSGPGDRDGNVPGLRIDVLRTVAHSLSRRGFATIRWDKRGVGESKRADGKHPDPRMEALAHDARRWLDAADADPSLDATCAVLVGHSEGGWLGPLIADQDPRVRGVVLLGGAVSNLADILRVQLRLILEAHGATPGEIEAAERGQRGFLRALKQGGDRDARRIGLGDASSAWLRSHFAADPAAVAARLQVPALALLFENDLQVPASEASALRAAFEASASPRAEVHIVPGLDHLLRRVAWKPGMGVYSDPDRVIDADVTDIIADFAADIPCAARAFEVSEASPAPDPSL